MIGLSIIIASSGRPSLRAAVDSVLHQLRPGDEVLVDVNDTAPWGHRARNLAMPRAKGDALLFLDDDDCYIDGALDVMRKAVEVVDDRPHIFRMRYPEGPVIWTEATLRLGMVSTQMICVPNIPEKLGVWKEDAYEGDWYFIKETVEKMGQPCFHSEITVLVRPGERR
jgi:glycosyltransferase involved in cell wall biosynthesis